MAKTPRLLFYFLYTLRKGVEFPPGLCDFWFSYVPDSYGTEVWRVRKSGVDIYLAFFAFSKWPVTYGHAKKEETKLKEDYNVLFCYSCKSVFFESMSNSVIWPEIYVPRWGTSIFFLIADQSNKQRKLELKQPSSQEKFLSKSSDAINFRFFSRSQFTLRVLFLFCATAYSQSYGLLRAILFVAGTSS